MWKLLVVLVLILACEAECGKYPFKNNLFLLIDCGVTSIDDTQLANNIQSWFPDNDFTDAGNTSQISDADFPPFLTTLRHFPPGEGLNCYDLPLTNKEKFLFRAGFYYANYDGKSNPPVFDLTLGGHLWATVNSSSTYRPIFHELLYTPAYGNISVCFRGHKNGAAPFISSLEATYLDHNDFINQTVYTKMRNGTAYHLIARINFGDYDKIIVPWSNYQDWCEEWLNRYWTPQQMSGYENIRFEADVDGNCHGAFHENHPPDSLLNTAITPQHVWQSIHVPVDFPTSNPETAYIVLYFHQNLNESETLSAARYMDIYVDGVMKGNVRLEEYTSTEVMTLYPVVVGATANVTVSPAKGTALPPLLNGMEVYIADPITEQPNHGFKISSSIWVFQLLLILFVFC